jgi:hypothetical protein
LFIDGNQTACTSCSYGRYQANAAATTCWLCQPGNYQNHLGQSVRSLSLFVTAPLLSSPLISSHLRERPFFCSVLVQACLACDVGSYEPYAGAYSCMNCSTAVTTGSAICPNSTGNGTVVGCQPGYYSYYGACITCSAGSYSWGGYITAWYTYHLSFSRLLLLRVEYPPHISMV